MFWTPDPLARTKRLLAIAENELLDAEKGVEDWTATAKALRVRVARLKAACKPAPTEKVESVAKGDITHTVELALGPDNTLPDPSLIPIRRGQGNGGRYG